MNNKKDIVKRDKGEGDNRPRSWSAFIPKPIHRQEYSWEELYISCFYDLGVT